MSRRPCAAILLLWLTGCSAFHPPVHETDAAGRPICWIRSPALAAMIYLPDAEHGHYRGPRFDWSGMIGIVQAGGQEYFGSLYPDKDDPRSHDYNAVGPADEFGMTSPLAYDETLPGESFIKIGVGHLARPVNEKQYAFYNNYRVSEPAVWRVEVSDRAIRFCQSVTDPRGWGYRYEKSISLSTEQPELLICNRFVNTGTRRIITDVYPCVSGNGNTEQNSGEMSSLSQKRPRERSGQSRDRTGDTWIFSPEEIAFFASTTRFYAHQDTSKFMEEQQNLCRDTGSRSPCLPAAFFMR